MVRLDGAIIRGGFRLPTSPAGERGRNPPADDGNQTP
jgi:hypothetical protein